MIALLLACFMILGERFAAVHPAERTDAWHVRSQYSRCPDLFFVIDADCGRLGTG